MKRHGGVFAFMAALSVLVTWPTAATLGTAIPGERSGDVYEHLWGYWWFFREFSTGAIPFRSSLSHWPPGGVLWFVDPFGALVSVPLQAVMSAASAFSVLQLLLVWGALMSGYALGWRATGEKLAAILAGIIYGASPYALSLLHSGTTEYLHMAPVPLFWLAMERVIRAGGWRPTLAAVACWAWATLASFYYAAFLGLLVPIAVWSYGAGKWREPIERAAVVIMGFGVAAAPIVLSAWWTLHSPDAVVSVESAPGWSYVTLPATDLMTFLRPGKYYFPDNRSSGNFGIIHVNYLGWVALAAAMVGIWRAKEWRLPLGLVGILALGPSLCWHGKAVRLFGTVVPMPMALLYVPGSLFRFVHHPFRVIVLVMMFMGVAAAAGVRGRPRLAGALSALILAETMIASPAVWPIPTSTVVAPAWYSQAAVDSAVTGIWDFPPDHRGLNRWYESLQTIHGKPMPYGVNLFLPQRFKENHFVRKMLQCVRHLAVHAIPREGGTPLAGWTEKPVASKLADGKKLMSTWGYNRIVLHEDQLSAGERDCVKAVIAGPVLTEGDGIEVVGLE